MFRKGLMVGLIRPPCHNFSDGRSTNQTKKIILSEFSLWGVGPTGRRLCALERSRAGSRESEQRERVREKKLTF